MSQAQLVTLIVSTVFMAGGVWAYARATRRLRRLRLRGSVIAATVTAKEREETSERGVAFLFVTYAFTDRAGERREHTVDVERTRYFASLQFGEPIDILHDEDDPDSSYPRPILVANERVYRRIVAGLAAAYLALNLAVLLLE